MQVRAGRLLAGGRLGFESRRRGWTPSIRRGHRGRGGEGSQLGFPSPRPTLDLPREPQPLLAHLSPGPGIFTTLRFGSNFPLLSTHTYTHV